MYFLRKMLLSAVALFLGDVAVLEVDAARFDVSNVVGADPGNVGTSYFVQKIANHFELYASETETISASGAGDQSADQPQTLTCLGSIKAEEEAVQPPSSSNPSSSASSSPSSSSSRSSSSIGPSKGDYLIVFPADGHQPTTEEAVEYSCANIDNTEDSSITKWYMRIFGVPTNELNTAVPITESTIFAGFDTELFIGLTSGVKPIIEFNENINSNDMVMDPDYGGFISKINLFIANFRKIATNPVGRTLLYRILIEIRRCRVQYTGRLNVGINGGLLLARRNRCRSIQILWDDKFLFNPTIRSISIKNFENAMPVIGRNYGAYDSIVKHYAPIDVILFHEMNHWFHWLLHPERYVNESNTGAIGAHLSGRAITEVSTLGDISFCR